MLTNAIFAGQTGKMDTWNRSPMPNAVRPLTTTYGGPSFSVNGHEVSCIGLTGQTWKAIAVVAREFPNVTYESIVLAREELERQSGGRQSNEAMARYRQYRPAVDLTTRQKKSGSPSTVGF
jgi:hypothetical protein